MQLYDTAQTTVVQHTAKFDPETGDCSECVNIKTGYGISRKRTDTETVNSETVSQEKTEASGN